ncbi:hypothetical protein [Streptomyces sp. NPDC051569]|uniref:hypothetical protein n=1 Tax=Streptomyces sp. NPDC051569 TaxID=3365661 RepID=UPI00378F4826
MSDPIDTWTHRLQDLTSELNPDRAHRFVEDVYRAAQADLDEKRAEAEFEREE